MKIALLTMFNGLNESYSLVSAVKNQIKMLMQNGHEVSVLVSEHCPDTERTGAFAHEQINWVKIINNVNGIRAKWVDYTLYRNISPDFWILAKAVENELFYALQNMDICILHDILYQGLHLVHNTAVRNVQKRLPSLRFLAFTHSMPRSHEELNAPFSFMYSNMPNTIFVCPAKAMAALLSEQYNLKNKNIAVVPTAVDISEGMSLEVKQILKIKNFYKPEFIMIYPARAVASKGHNLLARFAGELKRISGNSVLIIFCDSYGDARSRRLISFEMQLNNITQDEYLCTSQLGFVQGLSHIAVLELFTLSNLFVFPSMSETQGLIALEAASRGNFLVMHSQTPALCEIGEKLTSAMYNFRGYNLSSQPQNHEEAIKAIIKQIKDNPVIQAKNTVRKSFSPEYIYCKFLAPLLS